MPNFIEVGTLQVRAIVQTATFNEENRTVEVCFGSDAPVRMMTYDGPVWETLSFEARHINLSRLETGAPLLDNHNRYGSVTENVIGVVESARTDGKKGYAVIRFSKGDKGERAMNEVKDGILRNISVGYAVTKYERTKSSGPGQLDSLKAIAWEPYEISIVPVNADRDAQVRGANDTNAGEKNRVEIVFTNPSIRTMEENGIQTDPVATAAAPPVAAPAPPPVATDNAEAVRALAVTNERTRVREINQAVRAAGLDADFAEKLVTDGTGIDQARGLIIAEFAAARGMNPTNPSNPAGSAVGTDRTAEERQVRAGDALFLRAQPGLAAANLTAERRAAAEGQFRGFSLLDVARNSLESAGIKTAGMDKMEIAKRAISSSTSDFPLLLEGVNRRVLLAAYGSIPDTWRTIAKVGSVSDFRPHSRIRQGTFGNLDTVPETAEYKVKPLTDGNAETISAKTKGNIVNVSRQMIINDDLGAFTDIAARMGRAAARSIEADVYAMFALNSGNGPTMGDGLPLFHASHGNINTPAAAPTILAIDAARVQLAQQKDQDGNDFLDIRPDIFLGPIGLGGTARVLNEAQYDVDVSNKFQVPNRVRGLFRLIVDTPRLAGTAWYILANPMDEPVLEVVFLDGVQTPYIEQQTEFIVDGISWKIRLDYGVGAIGWRGAIKNAGA